jgi:hypothetical protein
MRAGRAPDFAGRYDHGTGADIDRVFIRGPAKLDGDLRFHAAILTRSRYHPVAWSALRARGVQIALFYATDARWRIRLNLFGERVGASHKARTGDAEVDMGSIAESSVSSSRFLFFALVRILFDAASHSDALL